MVGLSAANWKTTGGLSLAGTWGASLLVCRQRLGLNLRARHFFVLAVVLVAEPAVGHGLVVLRVEHTSIVHQMKMGMGYNEARGFHVWIWLIVGHHWQSITFHSVKKSSG